MLKQMCVLIYFLLLASTKVELLADKRHDNKNTNVNTRETRECLAGFKSDPKLITSYLDMFNKCFKVYSFAQLEPRLVEFLLHVFQMRINKVIAQRKATRKYWYLRGGRASM